MTDRAFRFDVRVYYEDTDFSGVVYHASYLRFMERARTEMLRERDIHQGAIQAGDPAQRFGFAVRAMNIEFLKPARMDDLLVVETVPDKIGGATIDLSQKILRGADLLLTAKVRIACIADSRPARIPSAIKAILVA